MFGSSTPKTKANWIPAFHEIFIDLCLEQTLKGNKPGTHFTKEGWRNIVESFYKKTGLSYDKKQMKNHWDSTKEQWKVWCKLIDASFMKWNPERNTFGASGEDWTYYIQVTTQLQSHYCYVGTFFLIVCVDREGGMVGVFFCIAD